MLLAYAQCAMLVQMFATNVCVCFCAKQITRTRVFRHSHGSIIIDYCYCLCTREQIRFFYFQFQSNTTLTVAIVACICTPREYANAFNTHISEISMTDLIRNELYAFVCGICCSYARINTHTNTTAHIAIES